MTMTTTASLWVLMLCIVPMLGASAAPVAYNCFKVGEGEFKAVEGPRDATAVAWLHYDAEALNETGWSPLKIDTNRKFGDADQMRAAGFCEGYVTWEAIYYSRLNWFADSNWQNGLPASIKDFMTQNLAWTQAQAAAHWNSNQGTADEKRFWVHTYLVMQQIQGMSDGYTAASSAGDSLTVFDIFFMQAQGDVETLQAAQALAKTGHPQDEIVDLEEAGWNPVFHEHCSHLTKVTDDGRELFTGHATWSGWGTFMRMYKTYLFRLTNNTKGPNDETHAGVSFSAYPATISSIDDWYVTTQGIVVTETTNGIFNKTMFKMLKPQSILSWIRVVVANRIATDGEEWTDIFAIDNSGTYNNQWIVVDYNKFVPSTDGTRKPLAPGTLWIAEQVPGLLKTADMTDFLNQYGYWPSYNIPYFPEIFAISGFQSMVDKYGAWFSYEGSPRALIFKREQGAVNSLGTYQFLMRFNEWQTDPFANGNAGNGIASRFDLVNQPNPTNPFLQQACFGAMDAKVTSAEMMSTRRGRAALAISGPTFYQQPVFKFSESICNSIVHIGTPDVFNFGWEEFSAW